MKNRANCHIDDFSKYQNQLDKIANIYSEEIGFEKTLIKYKIRSIKAYLHGKYLLDVGCGVGLLCSAFARFFEVVVGIDGSHKKILKANDSNTHSNVTYIETIFEDFNSGQSFDTILATNVLEHVENPTGFLKHLKRLLSPGGKIIITVPHALGIHKRIGKKMGLIDDFYKLTNEDIDKGHRRIHDKTKLIDDLTSASLEISLIEGIFLKPLSNSQMESWDINICDALYEIGKELPDYCSSLLVVAYDPSRRLV